MSKARKVHVRSFGCQMNVYDSHRMADTLVPAGFTETANPEHADLVILNTCHIREKAAEKVYSEIGRIREMKEAAARDGRSMLIAVAGCVAQAEGKEIIRRANAVDLVRRLANSSPPAVSTLIKVVYLGVSGAAATCVSGRARRCSRASSSWRSRWPTSPALPSTATT